MKTALNDKGKIALLKKILPKRGVFPITEYVLIKPRLDGSIRAIATNLENWLEIDFEGINLNLPICIPIKDFELLLKEKIGTVNPSDFTVKIGGVKVTGENSEDFPSKPELTGEIENRFIFRPSVLAELVPFLGNEKAFCNENLYHFGYIQDNGKDFICATDAHGLKLKPVSFEWDGEKLAHKTIIPKEVALLKDFYACTCSVYSGNWEIKIDDITLICRKVEQTYPDVLNVIPTENPILFTVNRENLKTEIEKAVKFGANQTSFQCVLDIHKGKTVVSACELDFGREYLGEIEGSNLIGSDSFKIGFNGKLLIRMLAGLKGETVDFCMSTANRACVIEEEGNLLLLMPMDISRMDLPGLIEVKPETIQVAEIEPVLENVPEPIEEEKNEVRNAIEPIQEAEAVEVVQPENESEWVEIVAETVRPETGNEIEPEQDIEEVIADLRAPVKVEITETEVVDDLDEILNELGLQPVPDVRIVDYSEKALAVIGETFAIKDELKGLGGRFCRGLSIDGIKTVGWVFSKKSHSEKLFNFLNN